MMPGGTRSDWVCVDMGVAHLVLCLFSVCIRSFDDLIYDSLSGLYTRTRHVGTFESSRVLFNSRASRRFIPFKVVRFCMTDNRPL
jgi:hypothetical protein